MKNTKPFSIFKVMGVALLGAMISSSCKKEDVVKITPPLEDNSLPSAAVYNVKVLAAEDTKIRFAVDLAVFKDSKNMENGFGAGVFAIDTLNAAYAFKTVKASLNGGGNSSSYSTIMLMDQSGSTSSTDPRDLRIDAGKIFCWNMGGGNESWVWWFASNYNKIGTGFITDTSQLVKDIESVRTKPKGDTRLYQSQHVAVQDLAAGGSKPVKALLTFTDGQNNLGSVTSADVITEATAKNVRLYNIGLGASSDQRLLDQAIATGGAFMYAKDAQQLISMFGNLGKLLDGSARFYSVEFEMTRVSGGTISKNTYRVVLKITTPWGYVIDIPVSVVYQ